MALYNDTDLSRIPWHGAFFQAMQLELKQYKDILQFYSEYQLTTEPLRIDVLIIKKTKNVAIKKNIAAIFRAINIVEYKSPGDYVSVEDFYKVYGYACLYVSLNKIAITDLTISFVESRHPRELLAHLRKQRGFQVAEKSPGIYTVKGDIIPMQVIDSRKLSEDDNLWLKDLRGKLEPETIDQILGQAIRQGKAARPDLYLRVIYDANAKTIREKKERMKNWKIFEQMAVESGWVAKWEAKGKAEGIAEGKAELLATLKKSGYDIRGIKKILKEQQA